MMDIGCDACFWVVFICNWPCGSWCFSVGLLICCMLDIDYFIVCLLVMGLRDLRACLRVCLCCLCLFACAGKGCYIMLIPVFRLML